jgi:sugar lactone lactonase YvrE
MRTWRAVAPVRNLLIPVLFLGAASGAVAQTCPTDTTRGALVVAISPGPNGEPLTVALTGPGRFSATVQSTTTYNDLPAGPYRAQITDGKRVTAAATPIGRAWSPVVRGTPACVRAGAAARLAAAYAVEPGSHKLWIVDDLGSAALALAPDVFAATGTVTPAARRALGMNKPKAVAFDAAGNMWVADISGAIASFGVWSLSGSGAARPRLTWTGPAVAAPAALAFDAAGGLWVASREHRVSRFAPEHLSRPRAPAPHVTLSVPEPHGLAFDASGNLWVASGATPPALLRYDAARLDGSRPGPPDATVIAESPPPVIDELRGPAGLAFDRDGNLWVGYFGPNVIARLTAQELSASGRVTPAIQLSLSVAALLESLAFDESGALWVPGESGQVLRLAPDQLRRSGTVTPPVVLTPGGLRYAVGLAVNPAVSWSAGGAPTRR